MNTRDIPVAGKNWVNDVLESLKKAQNARELTCCMQFTYVLPPERMEEYKQLQTEISKLINEENNRPVIVLHIMGKDRSLGEKPDIGLLGGMGPLSDAHITSSMFKDENGECKKDDNAYLLLMSSPPTRDEEPEAQKKKHKAFRLKMLTQLGAANCQHYTMLSNTAHLHRQGFRYMTGDYSGIINKITGTTTFINLVREISKSVKNDNPSTVLVLGTTEAAIGNLYPSELGDSATFQFGKKAPTAKSLPLSQKQLQEWINAAKTSEEAAKEIRDKFIQAIADWVLETKPSHVVLACTEIPLFLSYPHEAYGTNADVLFEKIRSQSLDEKLPKFIDSEEMMIKILNEERRKLQPSVDAYKQKIGDLLKEVDANKSHPHQKEFLKGLQSLLEEKTGEDKSEFQIALTDLKKQYPHYNLVKTKLAGKVHVDSIYGVFTKKIGTTSGQIGTRIDDLVGEIQSKAGSSVILRSKK
jgi:aspartate/glutamate racemase